MKPINETIARLRQRRRADGTWRVWWEPETAVKALGFDTLELDPDRPTWSTREAERLNLEVARKRGSAAKKKKPKVRTGGRSVDDLIEAYRKSRKYLRLAEATRRSYDGHLSIISAKWGEDLVARFSKRVMHAWYESLYEERGAWQAKALVRQMSILFTYAELLDWRPENSNPCFKLSLEQPAGRRRTASWAELDALVAAADELELPEIGLAVMLSAMQGQRQTDVRLARKEDFRKVQLPASNGRPSEALWVWSWTRSKRKNRSQAPIHPDVQPLLEAALERGKVEFPELLLDSRTGRPLSLDLFQKRWGAVRARAADAMPSLEAMQFRDLRRTFGALARAGGASRDDTADVLGNSAATNPELAEIYMAAQFETIRRAVDAVRRPEPVKKRSA